MGSAVLGSAVLGSAVLGSAPLGWVWYWFGLDCSRQVPHELLPEKLISVTHSPLYYGSSLAYIFILFLPFIIIIFFLVLIASHLMMALGRVVLCVHS